eukprot:2663138-Prymnesium_polylepis.1
MIGCRYLDTDASTALASHQSKYRHLERSRPYPPLAQAPGYVVPVGGRGLVSGLELSSPENSALPLASVCHASAVRSRVALGTRRSRAAPRPTHRASRAECVPVLRPTSSEYRGT